MRFSSREEIKKRVYREKPYASHWDVKKAWIDEAIKAGGKGYILCDDCSVYNEYGFGSYSCSNCAEAVRIFPNGIVEEWFVLDDEE